MTPVALVTTEQRKARLIPAKVPTASVLPASSKQQYKEQMLVGTPERRVRKARGGHDSLARVNVRCNGIMDIL